MSSFDEVVKKGIELNNAIKKLNEDTKVINSIVAEKRIRRKEDIINDLQKYIKAMDMLDIDVVEIETNSVMYYYGMSRLLGIKIRRHERGTQIDLGCISDVMNGFYAYHSIGWVISGCKNESVMNGFCDCWDRIKSSLDNYFADAIETILDDRRKESIEKRERAINDLTSINH